MTPPTGFTLQESLFPEPKIAARSREKEPPAKRPGAIQSA